MKNLIEIAQKDINEVISYLNTSLNGLTENYVQEILKIYGFNKIISFKIDFWEIIKRNSLNFFNLILLLSTILSLIINGFSAEPLLIIFFLILSISISIFQDYRVNKLSESLLSYFKNYAFVKRNNQWQKINTENLVPGDYVKVIPGYLIPADIRILKSKEALVDESVLTGESEPIFKSEKYLNQESVFPSNIALMGTTLIKGEIEGIVFATGKESYFGSLAKKTLEIKKESSYQKILNSFAKNIGLLSIFVSLLIIFINLLKPNYSDFNQLVIFAIVLSVAIVPEFLPSMTVLALSLCGLKLGKKGLVIKRLSSIEDLGAIEVLCTDKTGTITTNKLSLDKIISNNQEEFIKYFLADYYFTKEITPYEQAIISFLNKENKNIDLKNFYIDWQFIEDIEFDPLKRIKKFKIKNKDGDFLVIKGAPEELITDKKWLEIFYQEDKKGLRTLALVVNNNFWGIASFVDPLKETAFSAINLAKNLNIEIKILTGDSLNVAREVALKLGLINENDKVVLGKDIRDLKEEDFKKIVKETKVFARVLPDDKLKIIQTLQKENFVAFLGEGVNDAPALKIANVAIVVDNSTDVAKQEADIILKEKDLNTIVIGIYEGRKVLTNIGKYIKHTMSDNLSNLISVAILSSFLLFVPLTPIQILLTNFLTDFPLIAFANDNVSKKEIRKPIKISNKELIMLLISLGLISGIMNIFAYLFVKNESVETIRTYIFYITTLTGIIVSFLIRTKDWFIFSKPSLSFLITSIASLFLTLIFIFFIPIAKIFDFVKLEYHHILFSLILLLIFIIGTEIAKKLFYKKFPDSI